MSQSHPSQSSKAFLHSLNVSKQEILALDPKLFSAETKRAYVELLYGSPEEWSWKRELQSVPANLRRWKLLLGNEPAPGAPYRVSHDQLLFFAKKYPPKRAGQTVTDFADWIFRLYVPERDQASLLRGRHIEREIAACQIPVPSHSRWKLEHRGMGNEGQTFDISELAINGNPLRGKPDLVLREKGTKRILIVEVKTSEAHLSSDGWPNLRAQLWAYSKIDAWRDADEILLVGEIWGFTGSIRLRHAVRWRKGDQPFDQQNAELFACYRSYCESIAGSRNAIGT